MRPPLAAILAALLLAGCGSSSNTPTIDPSTVLLISGETLVPIPPRTCHVKGTIQNTSFQALNVFMQWQALDVDGVLVVGTVSLNVNDIKPGETRPFETTGFINGDQGLFPCSRIITFVRNQTTVNKS